MYAKYAPEYLKQGLLVIPLNGKIPIVPDWVNVTEDDCWDCTERFPDANIGILCGKVNDIVGIDIDVDVSTDLFEKIVELLPDTVGKFGKKGATFFYSYSGEKSQSVAGIIDILSCGRQSVLPPSIHPDTGTPYMWCGNTSIKLNDLPELENLDKILKLCGAETENISSGGRNDTLKNIAMSMFDRGESFEDVITEVLTHDKNEHSEPLFEDEKEYRTYKTPIAKACYFVGNIQKTLLVTGWTPTLTPRIEIVEPEKIVVEKFKKYPHLRGIGKTMFDWLYENSMVPRSQYAFASILSLASVVLANKVRMGRTHSNLYTMLIGPSGVGKNDPLNFPKKVLHAANCSFLIGGGSPTSEVSVIAPLTRQTERIDIVDEASKMLSSFKSSNSFQSAIEDTYAQLYTSAGEYFDGKYAESYVTDKNPDGFKGRCFSPCVSLFCALTPEAFEKTFDSSIIEKGLGARFMYFYEPRLKKPQRLDVTPIPQAIIDWVQLWCDGENPKAVSIQVDHKAKLAIDSIDENYFGEKYVEDNGAMSPMYRRFMMQMEKLILLDCCLKSGKKTGLVVMEDSVKWAFKVMTTNLHNTQLFMDEFLHNSTFERHRNKIISILEKAGKNGVTRTKIGRHHFFRSFDKTQLRRLLDTMEDAEELFTTTHVAKNKKKVQTFFAPRYIKTKA